MGAEGHRYSHTAPPRPCSFSRALSLALPFYYLIISEGEGFPSCIIRRFQDIVCCFRQSCLGYAAEMGSFPASCSPADLFRQPRMLLPGLGLPQRVEVATVNRAKCIMVPQQWHCEAWQPPGNRGVTPWEAGGKPKASHQSLFKQACFEVFV